MSAYARSCGLLVVADGKRGDIGSTARAYAEAYLESGVADALTVNPYMGRESIEPFIASVPPPRDAGSSASSRPRTPARTSRI